MPDFTAKAGDLVTLTARVDKRPYLAGFQTPPHNSNWEDIRPDADGMGESRKFKMAATPGTQVSFNAQFDEQVGSDDPDPKATYTIAFSGTTSGTIGGDQVVVPKDSGPVSREYRFTAT